MVIHFESPLLKIGPLQIINVPLHSSKELSSRGIVMVRGTINTIEFKTVLEPDGKGSHWIEINPSLSKEIGANIGENVSVTIEQTKEWIEPQVPSEFMAALTTSNLLNQWDSLTPKSRWEWIRWIRSTKNAETRSKRIDVACSKLQKGDKNPCCFNAASCTVMEVSKAGKLLDE